MSEWLVELTCCGRENGYFVAPTWDKADAFRESYFRAEGHDRSAIIVMEARINQEDNDDQ